MSEVERTITLVLPNGEERDYYPPHVPVSQQNGSTMAFMWEEEDGEVFSLAVNVETIAALEMSTKREDQDEEVLALIDETKAKEAETGSG